MRRGRQVRQSTITKLQGEVSRAKARADRKRKQLEAQLGQSQLELRDAQSRAEVAQEQLRKVRAQHSRQLRVVKSQTTSLTEEWDAHIRETEAAKREMDELLQQELDLRSSEQRFLQQEEEVQIQAQEAQEVLQSLEYQTAKLQDDREALLLAQRPLEEEHDLIQEQVKAIKGLSEADSKKSEEMRSEASVYREEIAAHRLEFAAQEAELETLASLEKQVAESREARDALKSERSRLEDSSKALQQSLEQQLGELREARRRCLQLKASHDEFVKLVPPASMRQVTLSTGAEQVLTRASRKAEQLQAAFEGQSSGRNTGRRPRTSTAAAASSPVASTASLGLQQKLTQMAENSLKEELQECRRSLVEHQQRVLEKARKRGDETQKLRSERRSLEEADPETPKAAEIRAEVEWAGKQQLWATGPVMLVAFDAREDRWGAVKDSWGQMTCDEKLSAANMKRQLGENHDQKNFNFRINIHQTTAARDWHFALLTCGNTEQADLTLRLVATSGALNMFEANTHFDASSCPAAVDVPWMEAAHDEVGFWLLLAGAVVFGCSTVLATLACRQCRKKGQLQKFRETSVAGGAEPVIGRPCSQIGEEKVVDGQTNTDMAAAKNEVATPDSCV
ncbi:unnamed protein product [Symbiodinium sp. KB8]|nr:unnamed protein product [Symbiodinium sp. KB8]